VVSGAFRVMAIKDEYEVARLYADGRFAQYLRKQIGTDRPSRFHLAPPLLARRVGADGRPAKRAFGAWIGPVFKVLWRLRRIRETFLDPFRHTHERRDERRLRERYLLMIEVRSPTVEPQDYESLVALARLPETVRGFGVVKTPSLEAALRTLESAAPRPGDGVPPRESGGTMSLDATRIQERSA
jgi:indolepyruvate ferredoxin oxidoreductase